MNRTITLGTAATASRPLTFDELTAAQRAIVEVGLKPGETFIVNDQGQIVGGSIPCAFPLHRNTEQEG